MVKKKSKYRHISINKKRYYFYEIKWMDILGDSGHANTKEFDAMRPAIKITYGFIYKKDRNIYGLLILMMKRKMNLQIVMYFRLVA